MGPIVTISESEMLPNNFVNHGVFNNRLETMVGLTNLTWSTDYRALSIFLVVHC
jgi:hypothetical protein